MRPHQRLQMRRQRRQHAEEDRLEFRNVVALRAFLDVVEIIEAEADDLAGPRDRQRVFQAGERAARGGRRLLGEIGERLEVAVAPAQHFAEIGRQLASTACRSMTLSPSTTPSRKPIVRFETRRSSWSPCPACHCWRQGLRAAARAARAATRLRRSVSAASSFGEAHSAARTGRLVGELEGLDGEIIARVGPGRRAARQPAPRASAPSFSIEYL